MWRLYLKTNEGVAIQTNPKRLFSAFESTKESISHSKIRYINYDNDFFYNPIEYPVESVNSLTPFVHKRNEFKSENEFRLFSQIQDVMFYQGEEYWNNRPNHIGSFIEIDVNRLVENVILPPNIDEQAQVNIESISNSLGYSFNFRKYSMERNPTL